MTVNVLAFITAAFLEIAGCFAFRAWPRRGASPLIAFAGTGGLIGFAVALTRVDSIFAGPQRVRASRASCAFVNFLFGLNFTSWNRIGEWLRRLEAIRYAA